VPAGRGLAVDFAQTVAELFGDAENRLLSALANQVRTDANAEQLDRARSMGRIRAAAESILARLDTDARGAAQTAVLEAFAAGSVDAVNDLVRLGGDGRADWAARRSRVLAAVARLLGITRRRDARLRDELAELRRDLPGVDAALAMVQELVQRMSSTHLQVMRWTEDAYRRAVAAPAVDVLLGSKTRLRASEVAWDALVAQGITGFTDKSGRNWNLTSYVEMATRATTAQAAIEGHLAQLRAAGIDLVTVPDQPQECELCRPWEGQILAITGRAGPRQVEHATRDGVYVTVNVKATLAEAVAAGFMHPNCRHTISAYTPGITRLPTNTADPKGDANRQELRRLERETRKAKRRAAAALTPETRKAWERRVRNRQAQIRDHVAKTGLHRQRHREQLDGLDPVPGPLPPREPRRDTPERRKVQPPLDGLAELKRREAEREPAVPEPIPALPEPEEAPAGPRSIVPTDAMDALDRKREITDAVTALFEGKTFGGLHVVVAPDDIKIDSNRIAFTGEIHNAAGGIVGTVERSLRRDGNGIIWANHQMLTINGNLQGQGFSHDLNGMLFDWYREQGVTYVKLFADIDVGGYAWARNGYDWATEKDAEGIIDQLWTAMADEPEPVRDAARALLERAEDEPFGSEGYPTPYEVSQLGRQEGDVGKDATWLGKRVMLGSKWYGVREV